MKKTFTAIITMTISAAIMPMIVSVASADPTVTMGSAPYYSGNGGGEFTAYTSVNYLNGYAAENTYNGGFETFCLETGVDVVLDATPPNPYNYTLSSATVGTGAMPLSQGAAYLYAQFAQGNLTGYNYGVGRAGSDLLLQAAIWYLMGQQTYNTSVYVIPTTSNNIFYAAAANEFGGVAGADANYTGSEVQVMNLWDAAGNPVQNQLVFVPDGGMTVMLLGIGLVGVGLVSRRLAVAR
jgi:hypothetical protein